MACFKIEKLIDVDACAACRLVILYLTERRTRWYHKEKIALRAGFSREPGLSLVSNTIRYFALRTDQLLEFPLTEVGHTLIPQLIIFSDVSRLMRYFHVRIPSYTERGGGAYLSPSSIYNGINSNVSCELHAGRKCFFFTSVGWSFYTPVTCVLKLRQRVQHFNYKLRIDIN